MDEILGSLYLSGGSTSRGTPDATVAGNSPASEQDVHEEGQQGGAEPGVPQDAEALARGGGSGGDRQSDQDDSGNDQDSEGHAATIPSDGRFNPLGLRWYVVVNDLVGGYSISHVDKPLSQQDPTKGEGEIADFITKEVAEHIARLHNGYVEMVNGYMTKLSSLAQPDKVQP